PATTFWRQVAIPHALPEGAKMVQPCLDELLGTVAHELRSPLATIVSGVQVIRECDMDPAARRALAVVERQAPQALGLVDDLFDVCGGVLGKLILHKEMVNLAQIVAVATETVSHSLNAKQHRLTVSLPPQHVSLEADSLRLAQVLTNLLGNAAKFTAP